MSKRKKVSASWTIRLSVTCPHCGEYQPDVYPKLDPCDLPSPGDTDEGVGVDVRVECDDCGEMIYISKIEY